MIVSKSIVWDLPQTDGTRNIRELQTDGLGNEYTFDYQADANMDIQAIMNNRVVNDLESQIAAQGGA